MTCRQRLDLCGENVVTTFDDISSATANKVQTRTFLHNEKEFEKCSWVVKAKKGAPTFKIVTADLEGIDKWDLHYAEYDHNISRHMNAGDADLTDLFVEPSVANTSGANKIYSKQYDKNKFFN